MTLREFVILARDQAYYLWGEYLDIYENSKRTTERQSEESLKIKTKHQVSWCHC